MKENQRVMLTKRLLKESLVRLLEKESVLKVSVRELCDTAGINRSTFYKHYGSQFDLLREAEEEAMTHIEEHLRNRREGQVESHIGQLTAVFTYLDDNVRLCRLLLNNTVDSDFPRRLIGTYLPFLKEHLITEYGEADTEYVSAFIMDGSYSIIRRWLDCDDREPPEEFAPLLIKLIMKLCPTM